MLDIDEIKRALHDRVLLTVSEHTGINRNTIALIKSGEAKNPSHRTMKALSDYLAPVHPSVSATKP